MIDDKGRRCEYEVFFRLRRGDAPRTLRLVVESAYGFLPPLASCNKPFGELRYTRYSTQFPAFSPF
jgi:hypothetical protein